MRVYLSSTLNDLLPERQAVKEALGGECTVVESYTADERNVRDSCLADVAGCDLYIGILGRRYGHIPNGETHSITELEYQQAKKEEIKTLIFIKNDDAILGKFHDAVTLENPPEKVDAFRKSITSRPDDFKTPEDLKACVLKALLRYSQQPSQSKPKRQRHKQSIPKPITGKPYPGLSAFKTIEADRFFGRDAEIDELLDRVTAHNQRFLAVIGASGSGKSSLVYAGLIAKLIKSPFGIRWIPVSFSPRELGNDPFLPLAKALKDAFPAQNWHPTDLQQQLFNQPGNIVTLVEQALATHDKEAGNKETDKPAQCLLFVDQFEELFTAKVDAVVRDAFFALIKAVVTGSRLCIVISMRSDFYSQWPQDDESIALLRSGYFPLGVPGAAALEKMIVEPAKAAHLTIHHGWCSAS